MSNSPDPSRPRNNGAPVWNEPRVRSWWIATAVVLLVAIGFGVEGYLGWEIEADLIQHGMLVQATITEAGGGPEKRVIAEDAAWDLKFKINGKTQVEQGYPPYTVVRRYNGDVIPIHVDPNDPEHWTNRPEPPPLLQKLIALPFILGLMVICAFFAILRTLRLKRILADGKTGWATIVSLGQSALAPRSYVVRCSWADGSSPTVYSVFVPRRITPAVGDRIQIAASVKSSLAIIASDAIERAEPVSQ